MRRIALGFAGLAAVAALSLSPVMASSGGPAAAGLTATFTLIWNWGSGYEAGYTIANNTAAAISGWSVSFDLPAGQQMGNYWNALETASGQHITFTNRDYNQTVPPNGGTVSFGFIVTGAFSPPVNCMISGSPCAGVSAQASPSPTPSPQQTGVTPQPTPSPTATPASPSASPTPADPSPSATQPSGGDSGAGAFAVAPYVDMTNNQEGMLDQAARGGLKAFTAAFVMGSGCTPIWGDTLPVTDDPNVTGEITRAETEGASPIVAFGGEDGIELAQSCPNLDHLVAAYRSVINALHVTRIDFDIEGAGIAETATNNLRFQAIKALEAANPGLVVSLTIPVLPSGPDNNGQGFLQLAHSDGVNVSVVNVLAMDYNGAFDSGGPNMGTDAIQAAQNTLSFLQTVFPRATYSMVGVTPMIGQNDDSAEVFTEADAHTLVSFAQRNHLGRLAFWSVDRDQPCGGNVSALSQCSMISQQTLDFTKIFDTFTG
jgi:cell division septation protein DedD